MQESFPPQEAPDPTHITGYAESITYLEANIKDLEQELVRHFNGDKTARDAFFLNIAINGCNDTLSLLEKNKNLHKTDILKDHPVGGENISNKPGVVVLKINDDYVAKRDPNTADSFGQIEAAKSINSSRIHTVTEIAFIDGHFYDVMSMARGEPIRREQIMSLSPEEKSNLYADIQEMENNGISIDISKHNNFYYEKGEGIHFIDLSAGRDISQNLEHFFGFFENTSLEEYQEFNKK